MMSGVPETARNQNTAPQRDEPHEVVVKHAAAGKTSMDWEARIPVLFWNVEQRSTQ